MGVATEPVGESRYGASWLTHTSIGNEVRILSALPGRIKTRIDPHANVAYYLGLRPKPRS